MKLFSLDGPFQRYGTMLFDLILLNIIWLLCVVFTLGIGTGAATTALFYSIDKSIIRENGYTFSGFFKSFKANFLQATLIWIILAVSYAVVLINLFVLDLENIPFGIVLIVVNWFVLYQLLILTIYVFPLISKVEIGNTKQYLITAFKLANGHVLASLACLFLVFSTCYLQYVVPLTVLIGTSISAILVSKIVVGYVLKKYCREEALDV